MLLTLLAMLTFTHPARVLARQLRTGPHPGVTIHSTGLFLEVSRNSRSVTIGNVLDRTTISSHGGVLPIGRLALAMVPFIAAKMRHTL